MGNAILDRARAHYAARGVQTIEVPEWGEAGQPLILYWTPITLSERQRIVNRVRDSQTLEAMVYAIIIKAQDAQGQPAFTVEDKHALMNSVDAAVVERISGAILAAQSVEDAEKN